MRQDIILCTIPTYIWERQGGRGWLAFGEATRIPQRFRRASFRIFGTKTQLAFVVFLRSSTKSSVSSAYEKFYGCLNTALQKLYSPPKSQPSFVELYKSMLTCVENPMLALLKACLLRQSRICMLGSPLSAKLLPSFPNFCQHGYRYILTGTGLHMRGKILFEKFSSSGSSNSVTP